MKTLIIWTLRNVTPEKIEAFQESLSNLDLDGVVHLVWDDEVNFKIVEIPEITQ